MGFCSFNSFYLSGKIAIIHSPHQNPNQRQVHGRTKLMKQQFLQKPSVLVANTPEYWDRRFERDYPLAPTAVRKRMTKKRYQKGCEKFGRNVFDHYRKLLSNMPPGDFWIIGAGNLDDTRDVIVYARSLGFRVFVADWSRVVVSNIRRFFRDILNDPAGAKTNVHHADLVQALNELVDYAETRVIHLSRILDHVDPNQREEVARILAHQRSSTQHLYLTIVNHDTDDNPHWLNKWKTVFPFNNHEFIALLSELNGSEIYVLAESEPWEVFTEIFRTTTAYLPPFGGVEPRGE